MGVSGLVMLGCVLWLGSLSRFFVVGVIGGSLSCFLTGPELIPVTFG
jgi:hypothetical protein